MDIKTLIKKIPGVNTLAIRHSFTREFAYDRNFFRKNYSHSKQTKNKLGYNILLITHALEKGMSNKNPRRFGIQKIAELISMIHKYEAYGPCENDFVFINAINTLRGYTKFYEEKGWTDANEYNNVLSFLNNYKKIKRIDAGEFILYEKDFKKNSKINYTSFLASRHSVRGFKKDPISDSDMKSAVEAAILSPSACNRQMCKIYLVSNKSLAKKVINMAQGFGGFEKETINPIIITFDVNANYFVGERNQGWFNAGLFSMNLVNALHSLGIGSCFCQFGNTAKEEEWLKHELNIPENERIAVIIAAGYYCDKTIITHSPRKSIEEIYKKIA